MLMFGYDITVCGHTVPEDMRSHVKYVRGYPKITSKMCTKMLPYPPKNECVLCEQGIAEYTNRKDYYYLRSEDTTLHVTADSIQYYSEREATTEEIFLGCIKPGVILVSKLRCRPVLHGNAILYKGQAYLFLAPSGTGKSTISYALYRYSEAEFLADDLLVLSENGTTIGTGYQALWLLREPEPNEKLHFENQKKGCYPVPLKCGDSLLPEYPIRAVVFLEGDTEAGGIEYNFLDENDFLQRLLRSARKPLAMNREATLEVWRSMRRMAAAATGLRMRIARNLMELDKRAFEITELFDRMG